MKQLKTACFFLYVFIFSMLSSGEDFPVPEVIKDNVAFWKKIYTEVSLTEGLLHDYEYPLIIYKKINVGTGSSRQRRRIIRKEKEYIKSLINAIIQEPESTWSKEVKATAVLFKTYASENALRKAADRIRFQQGQKERFRRGLYRSGAYIDSIKTILAKYNVPLRLAYLPHVESSFRADAYSKAGAAGLWQFMRSTGRLYMNINYSIDERRDPILSTYAAAKLLSHNYKILQAWPLAITAYNHGLNGMKRAVAQTGSRDIGVIIQKHSGRLFKFASKNFYSCFIAASEIAENPKHYFPDITFAPPVSYRDMKTDYYYTPSLLAAAIGITQKELADLNPAIRPIIFRQNKLIPKGTTIHIPQVISLASVRQTLDNLPDSLKITSPPRPNYYRVRRGDNLYAIARQFRVSARELAMENNITRMNRIYAGQVLRIPGSTPAVKKAEPVAVALQKDTIVKKKAEPAAEEIPDTLDEILMAKAESVTQSNLSVKSTPSFQFDASIYSLDAHYIPEEQKAVITITVNETIGHYAEWLDIPTQRIREINYMGRGSSIRIGQELSIPVENERAMDIFNQRRLEYHMALEEDFYNQYKVTELKPKIIERGETLWDICHEDGIIPLWLLKKYNKHITLAYLYQNMQIWLPSIEEKTEVDFKQEANTEWRGLYPLYYEPGPIMQPYYLTQ